MGLLLFGGWKGDVPRSEYDALKAFYNAFDGDNWVDNTGWLSGYNVNDWFGVTVTNGHVFNITLNSNGLNGTTGIQYLAPLTQLEELYLSQNTHIGDDIDEWGDLPTTLTKISMYHCDYAGDIAVLAKFVNAETLSFSANSGLTGDIADLAPCTAAEYLSFNSSQVGGDIEDISTMTALEKCYLYTMANLTGDLSALSLPSCDTLYVHGTAVTGGDIDGCPNVAKVRCYNNGWSQATVDAFLAAMYANRANFTDSTPELEIQSDNAAPGGVYQDGDPPTTGLEYVYELANDPESEGFNTWAITYNGGSAP